MPWSAADREVGIPSEEFEVDGTLTLRSRVSRFQRELAATPHLWVFIVMVYSYLALFALVVTLTVTRP